MPLDLTRYAVAVARNGLELDKALEAGEGDGYDIHSVTVLHADQLVAEQAAPRYGVAAMDADNPQRMTWATLWVWCALRRMTVAVPEFPVFKGRVISLDIQANQEGEAPDLLGPTGLVPDTDSPSSSQENGPPWTTG
jgi:hypothetical protein